MYHTRRKSLPQKNYSKSLLVSKFIARSFGICLTSSVGSSVSPLSAAPGTTDVNDTMDVDSVHRCLVAEKHVYGDVDPAQLPYDEHEADGVGFESGKSTGLVLAGIAVYQEPGMFYIVVVFCSTLTD